jgi:hypothetical protein
MHADRYGRIVRRECQSPAVTQTHAHGVENAVGLTMVIARGYLNTCPPGVISIAPSRRAAGILAATSMAD